MKERVSKIVREFEGVVDYSKTKGEKDEIEEYLNQKAGLRLYLKTDAEEQCLESGQPSLVSSEDRFSWVLSRSD